MKKVIIFYLVAYIITTVIYFFNAKKWVANYYDDGRQSIINQMKNKMDNCDGYIILTDYADDSFNGYCMELKAKDVDIKDSNVNSLLI